MSDEKPAMIQGIGLWQATALNVILMVGAGVFATIPAMLRLLPGPYALLAWVGAGILILLDGMVWSELGAAMPKSGGSYHFLLECYGRNRWGRLMAFLFLWQFMVSGPLELGSNLVAIALFTPGVSTTFADYDKAHTVSWTIWESQQLAIAIGPARLFAFGLGMVIVALLYRKVTTLGRMSIVLWAGLLAAVGWILVEGAIRFQSGVAFDFSGAASQIPADTFWKLGPAMMLAIYSYLGYYNVCYVGEEVRNPAKVIPRAILLSGAFVMLLFIGLHLAMMGTVSWKEIPENIDDYNLPAEFMKKIHGEQAAAMISVLLIGCCFGSTFAGLLGYSRIPYGAAKEGHFFSAFAAIHPRHQFPHRSLLLVGGVTLLWSFFNLQVVINALITTRLLEMFCGQIIGLLILRYKRPDAYRPWKMALYPLPSLLALTGWIYLYLSSQWLYILMGAATLITGLVAFLIWSWIGKTWPFGAGEHQNAKVN